MFGVFCCYGEIIMAEPKTIYCPRCGRKATTWDGRSRMDAIGKCSKCKKLVVYNPANKEITIRNIPFREQSSGIRFY